MFPITAADLRLLTWNKGNAKILSCFDMVLGIFDVRVNRRWILRNNRSKKERKAWERKRRIQAAEQKTERFLRYLFSMLVKMAKADGRVVEKEVKMAEKVFDRFDFAARHRDFCVKVFNSAKDNNRGILWYARMFRLLADDNQCMIVYELLWDVACADGILHPRQKKLLQEICPLLLYAESYFSINSGGASRLLGKGLDTKKPHRLPKKTRPKARTGGHTKAACLPLPRHTPCLDASPKHRTKNSRRRIGRLCACATPTSFGRTTHPRTLSVGPLRIWQR